MPCGHNDVGKTEARASKIRAPKLELRVPAVSGLMVLSCERLCKVHGLVKPVFRMRMEDTVTAAKFGFMPRFLFKVLIFLGLALLLYLLMINSAPAGLSGAPEKGILQIDPGQDIYQLAPWMDVLEDPTGNLNFEDIRGWSLGGQPRAVKSDTLNFGITSSVFWLRFRLRTSPDEQEKYPLVRIFNVGSAFAGRVDWALYEGTDGRLLASTDDRTGGDLMVRIRVTSTTQTYYLKVQSNTGLILRPGLYTGQAFLKQANLANIWYGIFYGIILAVAVYNLFLFFSLNDNSYFWYVVHLVFVALYFLGINGLTATYLLPSQSEDFIGMLSRSFLGLMAVSIGLFTRSFLMSSNLIPKIDRIIIGICIFAGGMSIVNVFAPARLVNTLLIVMGMVAPSFMIVAAWGALKSGFRPALPFLLAWGMFVLGGVSFSFTVSGILPFTSIGFNSFQGGAAVAAVLLSLALGDRIRTLRVERAEFKQSMDRVVKILDTMESGVFLIDSESRTIKEVNKSAEKILGRKREKIIGQPCRQFVRTPDSGECPILDAGHIEESREDVMITASGIEVPVLKRAKRIDLDGHDYILENFVDITDLRRVEEALRRSEAKFRSLFESSRDAVMLLDQAKFIDCNKATLEMFGCAAADEFIGRSPADFSPKVQPSGADSDIEAARKLRVAFERGSVFFEWRHKRLNGEEFPAEVMLSAVEVEGRKLIQGMVRDISRRKFMEEQLKRLASTDALTGVDNRRSFLEKGTQELLRSNRYTHSLAFMMMDVDHFKIVNDNYGHQAGDEVLKALASRSKEVLRATDLFGRLGGEEFGVLLPETDAENALEVADRLRRELAEMPVVTNCASIQVTVSIGVTLLERKDETLVNIMSRADSALYKAKVSGRNRVVQA